MQLLEHAVETQVLQQVTMPGNLILLMLSYLSLSYIAGSFFIS